jgi:hypothetical protein
MNTGSADLVAAAVLAARADLARTRWRYRDRELQVRGAAAARGGLNSQQVEQNTELRVPGEVIRLSLH